MQGFRLAPGAHCWLWKFPCSSMNTASPGAMSRSTRNPSASTATDSEATMYSVPVSVSLYPITAGRMPNGARNASTPWPPVPPGRKDGRGIEPQLDRGAFQLVRQHIEQHLGVRVGIDVPQVGAEHLLLQLIGVGEIAVVPEHDAERRIDVERLRLGEVERRAGGRIAAKGDAVVARESAHVARAEHVAHHAAALVHVERLALAGDDARRVLAAG